MSNIPRALMRVGSVRQALYGGLRSTIAVDYGRHDAKLQCEECVTSGRASVGGSILKDFFGEKLRFVCLIAFSGWFLGLY